MNNRGKMKFDPYVKKLYFCNGLTWQVRHWRCFVIVLHKHYPVCFFFFSVPLCLKEERWIDRQMDRWIRETERERERERERVNSEICWLSSCDELTVQHHRTKHKKIEVEIKHPSRQSMLSSLYCRLELSDTFLCTWSTVRSFGSV